MIASSTLVPKKVLSIKTTRYFSTENYKHEDRKSLEFHAAIGAHNEG